MARLSLVPHSASLISGKLLAAPISRVAYATDLRKTSGHVLYWAIQMAKANEADLLLLHVLPSPVPLFEAEPFERPDAELALSLLLAEVKATGISPRGFLLTGTGSIYGQIVRAARLERVDLIVMGSRCRSGLSRLLAGSLTCKVITHTRCPVLVVPHDDR
jgi:nucleotide-binding universal stress UspA family protein